MVILLNLTVVADFLRIISKFLNNFVEITIKLVDGSFLYFFNFFAEGCLSHQLVLEVRIFVHNTLKILSGKPHGETLYFSAHSRLSILLEQNLVLAEHHTLFKHSFCLFIRYDASKDHVDIFWALTLLPNQLVGVKAHRL